MFVIFLGNAMLRRFALDRQECYVLTSLMKSNAIVSISFFFLISHF